MNTAKIDLHLHLDGSIDLDWAYKVAQRDKVFGYGLSFDDYYQSIYYSGYKSREEGFKKYELTCAVLQSKQNLFEATYNLGKKLAENGLIYAEIRFASQQHCLAGLSQIEVLSAVIDGAKAVEKDYPSIRIRIIDCLMHKGDSAKVNEKENYETLEAIKYFISDGYVVAADLAGFENNCDLYEYEPLFKKARELNIPYTIHAGEMGNGENVVKALNMKANRIGHGVYCVDDPNWLEAAAKSNLVFEVCMSSNCKKQEYITHPIRKMLEAKVKVTFCCDNMMFMRTNLSREHQIIKDLSISEQQLIECNKNAVDSAFCDEETKDYLRKQLGY